MRCCIPPRVPFSRSSTFIAALAQMGFITNKSAMGNADIETFKDIKSLVDAFYSSIRQDEMLGPIFTDFANVDWVEHLPKLCEFWETVLFAVQGYKGDPIEAHVELHERLNKELDLDLQQHHFDHWVELFTQTVDDLFAGPIAEKAKRSAVRMAAQLLKAISNQP